MTVIQLQDVKDQNDFEKQIMDLVFVFSKVASKKEVTKDIVFNACLTIIQFTLDTTDDENDIIIYTKEIQRILKDYL